MQHADITFESNKLYVEGRIDFSNVMSLYQKSLTQLSSLNEMTVDFSRLQSSSSVGLALILEWIKYAKANGKKIHFEHIPSDLMAIAKVASIEQLIT